MPARRSRLYERKMESEGISLPFKAWWIFVAIVVFLLVGAAFLLYSLSRKSYWDGSSRLSMAIHHKEGDVTVAVFDPQSETITSVFIPKETQVRVAHGLGEWRIGSVWNLAEDEGVGGELLSSTVTKSFHFPTETWSDYEGLGFVSGKYSALFRSAFAPYKTNLSTGDKLSLALFSLRVTNTSRISYDMRNAGYLIEKRLVDGNDGYVTRGVPPAELTAIFADEIVSSERSSVVIVNGTGTSSVATEVGGVVEVLGAKVVAVQEEMVSENCRVEGNKLSTVRKLSQVFGCKVVLTEQGGIKIFLGEGFAERF